MVPRIQEPRAEAVIGKRGCIGIVQTAHGTC